MTNFDFLLSDPQFTAFGETARSLLHLERLLLLRRKFIVLTQVRVYCNAAAQWNLPLNGCIRLTTD